MTEEIKEMGTLIPNEDREQLYGWGEDIFGVHDLNMSWRLKDVRFVLYVDGQAASHAALLKHEITVGGKPLLVAGVGSVVTPPHARGRGYARRLMQHLKDFAEREWNVEGHLLFCLPRMVAYYEQLGWRTIEPVIIDQPDGKIESPIPVMVRASTGRSWPAGHIDLCGLPW